jgi:hypothetical protein
MVADMAIILSCHRMMAVGRRRSQWARRIGAISPGDRGASASHMIAFL